MSTVIELISRLLGIYIWVIIIRAVLSWVRLDPYNPIVRFLYEATEPVLSRIRGILPMSVGGMDFSPVIVIMGIIFLQSFLVPTLRHLAM